MTLKRTLNLANAARRIDEGVETTVRLIRRLATLAIGLALLLLVPTLPLQVLPMELAATAYYTPVFTLMACALSALLAGYLHAEFYGGHWQRIVCVVACYAMLDLYSNGLVLVSLVALHALLGAAAMDWLDRRVGDRAESAFERAPCLTRWVTQALRFKLAFLLAFVALSLCTQDLLATCLINQPPL